VTGEHRPTIVDLADVALSLYEESSTESAVESVVHHIRAAVAADHAGALLIGPKNQIETVAASDDVVRRVGTLQAELNEGPDRAMMDGLSSITVADTCDEKRWASWAQAVAALGIRSLVSVRLSTHERVFGSVNVYSRRPHAFAEDDRAVMLALGRYAAIAVSSLVKEENLTAAIDSRKLIGQAQGILMERFSLSEDQAFSVLLRYSQHSNMKLRAVAQRVVEERALPITPS
jgi:GAF domain-containing protein